MGTYTFPSHYPLNCPPQPHDEMCGTYYRLVKNGNTSDPAHFKSHYEANLRKDLESIKACSRRAVSMFKAYEDAIKLSILFPTKGKYIMCLKLTGGHGVVCEENYRSFKSHHNWWVPNGVNAQHFCSDIKGPVS